MTNDMFELINEIYIKIYLFNNDKKFILKDIVIPFLVGTFRCSEDSNFKDIPEIPCYTN